MTPRDVDDCTLWEFACAVEGYVAAHAAEDRPSPMSEDRMRELGIEGV